MRSTILALIAAGVPSALAHYNFEALIVNGNATSAYEYVRQTTNSNSPITDVTSSDFVCNQGGLDATIMAKTQTHTVAPGDEVGFTVNVEIGHPGPLAVYMSKAPDGTTAAAYKGDGDWFKVYELSTSSITDAGLQWATYVNNAGIHNFTFQLPDTLPAGQYLMRAEHVALHGASTKGGAQFYIGCAQLEVSGSGSGSPSPTVKIPGVYTGDEPGLVINIYYPVPTSYTVAGPATWPNACEDHTANFEGQTSDGDCTGSTSSGSSSGSGNSSVVASSAAAASTSKAAASTSKAAASTSKAAATSKAATSNGAAAPTGAASTSAASAARTSSAVARPSSTTAKQAAAAATSAKPTPASSSAAAPAATGGSSSLPSEFTLNEFISWLQQVAGSSGSSSKARRHVRDMRNI
ncbi:glycosyl hydrolase family 61-domain-containing protein [Whalleya microplaca]|nr:glycosyl hydrolase family 61-domain-containing protein [Whalleya microplaca]